MLYFRSCCWWQSRPLRIPAIAKLDYAGLLKGWRQSLASSRVLEFLAEKQCVTVVLTGGYEFVGLRTTRSPSRPVKRRVRYIRFERADLAGANLTGVNLAGTDLRATGLASAQLQGACYSEETLFPDGFDPNARGLEHIGR